MNFKNVDFVGHRKKFFGLSLVTIVAGLIVLLTMGLNLGIDFVSGSRVDINANQPLTEESIKEDLKSLGLPTEEVTLAGENNNAATARYKEQLNKDQVAKLKKHFTDKFGIEPGISTVSPVVGRELAKNAMMAVAIASIGIIIYVTIRFEILKALAAIIALLHDAFFIIAIFSILQLEVNITFIAAVLTIVGYSINDTIVTFDRIRENMRLTKVKTFDDLKRIVNDSLKQTLARSINTVLTVIFAAAALYIFGSEAIRQFSFALLVGLVAGTYSSLFIAAQLWLEWKGKQLKRKRFKSAENAG